MAGNMHFIARLKRAGECIIREKKLDEPNEKRASLFLGDVALNWLVLLAAVALLHSPVFIFVHWLLVLRLLNAMAQITHGCGHYAFMCERIHNRLLGELFSSLMGYRFDGHNRVHDQHHQFLNTPRDGDLLFGGATQSRREFLVGLILDLLGYQAWKRLLQYFRSEKQAIASYSVDGLWQIVVAQICLWAIFYWIDGPWTYLFVYAFPICTLYPAQARIRSLAEHHVLARDRAESSSTWMSRNTEAPFWERQLIGPYYQNYHLEHHLFPEVPGYNLQELHRLLRKQVVFEGRYLNQSYFGFMWRFLFAGEGGTLKQESS